MQAFADTVNLVEAGAISGSYSYLGQTYNTIIASETTSVCAQPGCYLSVSSGQSGDILLTLGYESSSGVQYLNLSGTAEITSSGFGQNTFDSATYYYSNGTFVVGSVPEPPAAAFLSGGLVLVIALTRHRRGRTEY